MTVKRSLQIDVEHQIPVGFFHAHDKTISSDTGIVHQNIDSTDAPMT